MEQGELQTAVSSSRRAVGPSWLLSVIMCIQQFQGSEQDWLSLVLMRL